MAFAILFVMVFLLTNAKGGIFKHNLELRTYMDDASGLGDGTAVRLNGIAIGYLDRLELKRDYERRGVRVLPGASARRGSFLSRGVILMPSYVNIGAWVGPNTMVDTWATVGSCAQIGANVHLSGGVGIGGVLEPANAVPVVIEDDAFIGSRCMVVEGARVGRGSVLGVGTALSPSIPVIDAATGEEVSRGHVPDYCVAVSANRKREFAGGEFFLPCVLIIRRMSEGERHNKVALNDILREHGVAT